MIVSICQSSLLERSDSVTDPWPVPGQYSMSVLKQCELLCQGEIEENYKP